MASEIVSSRSVASPVAKVMVAVGSAPRLLVTAPQTSRPSGQRQASQVRVLSRMRVERFIVGKLADQRVSKLAALRACRQVSDLESHPGLVPRRSEEHTSELQS